MTAPTNTFTTVDSIGRREDLSDYIYMVSPTHTPFMSGAASVDATAVLHEWQIDSLRSAAQNVQDEGDDATTNAVTATTRLSNTCQISDVVPRVSGTQQAVAKAGRRNEMSYQVAKMAKELKRDMENDLCANNAEVTGDASTSRELGGIPAWITTNTSNGTSGTDGSLGNTARTDGTQRSVNEEQLKTVLAACFDAGGEPDCILVGSFVKQAISGFTGNATRFKGAEDARLQAAIDIYDSDFGSLEIKPSRFSRARDALVLQMDLWAVAFLRAFSLHELAKTGDSERMQLITEFTLESRNEAGSGAIWDLSTS